MMSVPLLSLLLVPTLPAQQQGPAPAVRASTATLVPPAQMGFVAAPFCGSGVLDSSGGGCIGASSVPELGKLYPLNDKFWVDPTSRFVSFGGMSPTWPVTVLAVGDGIVQWNTTENIVVGSYAAGGLGMFGTYSNDPLGFFVNYGAEPAMTIDTGGNVGIGTTTPTDRLHLAGPAGDLRIDHALKFGLDTGFDATSENGDAITFFRFNGAPDVSNLYLHLGDDPTPAVNNDAFIIQVGGSDTFAFSSDGTAYKPGGGSWAVLSDRRSKRDIEPLAGTLETLLQLRGVSYSYKDPNAPGAGPGRYTGMIAQEVEEVFPEWVKTRADGAKVLDIHGFEALVVEAFRDQQHEIEALRRENEAQRERIDALCSESTSMAGLRAEVETLKTSLAALAGR